MSTLTHPSRRQALALLGAPALSAPLLWFPFGAHAAPGDTIKVLYRKESTTAPVRIDPAVEAATLALEDEFGKRGFRIVQPSAEAYRFLDQGPGINVTFAADAGFSMLFSLSKNVRPRPGSETGMAEVRLQARVFVGHNILSSDQASGTQLINLAPDTREFAERSGTEAAARKAAATLAESTSKRLKAIDPARLEEMSRLGPIKDVYDAVPVPVGAAPAPAEPPPAVAAAPAPAPSPAPAAAPSPAPAAAPAPAPAAAPAADTADANQPLDPPAKRFALIVGVSDYAPVRARMPGGGPGDLKGVAIDRKNIAASLKAIGFPEQNVQILADGQATSAGVRSALAKLVASTGPDDLVLIAISAHGAPAEYGPSGFGLPVLSDFAPNDANAIDFWELQSKVGNMRARRTVMFLDTCHSGGATQMMQMAVVSSSGISVQRPNGAQNAGSMASAMSSARHFAVVTASRAEELSLEDASGGGLFTSRLMKALNASAAKQPLETLFHEQVEKQVIDESRTMCSRMNGQCKVQTPQFAYSGRGNMIRL